MPEQWLTEQELAELEDLEQLATPKPWRVFCGEPDNSNDFDGPYPEWRGVEAASGEPIVEKCCGEGYTDRILNADFIAAARNVLPRLIAQVRGLQQEWDVLRAALDISPEEAGRIAHEAWCSRQRAKGFHSHLECDIYAEQLCPNCQTYMQSWEHLGPITRAEWNRIASALLVQLRFLAGMGE